MKCLLGIDIGTTGTKTILFSGDGVILSHAYQSYELSTPKVGWREQNAEDWWNAVVTTVREVCKKCNEEIDVTAISLSTQGGTMVAVDKDFKPVRPAMVWNDQRCTAERDQYLHEVGDANTMYEKTGWRLGNGLVAQQIRWMKNNEPDLFERTVMFLSVPDYISYKMTGIAAVDLSNVGVNRLGNIREATYDQEILRFAGVTEEKLPKIVHSGEIIGCLTPAAASELGLSTNTLLVAGAHDQYAVALGAGAHKDGDILVGSGTAWVITAISNEPDFSSGLAQSISATPGKWGSLCSLSTGGVCLEWLRKHLVATDGNTLLSYDTINEEVSKKKAAEDGLFFYPFSGRSTAKDNFTKATLIGLDLSHDRFNIARAVMEGVAFQVIWMMESFQSKPSSEGIKLAGGASKSKVWAQIVADAANLPVRIPEVADLACVGAAIMAGTGCHMYKDITEAYEKLSSCDSIIYPDPDQAIRYQKCFETYKQNAAALGVIYNSDS